VRMRASSMTATGATSGGLMTMVLPVAKATATWQIVHLAIAEPQRLRRGMGPSRSLRAGVGGLLVGDEERVVPRRDEPAHPQGHPLHVAEVIGVREGRHRTLHALQAPTPRQHHCRLRLSP
jgi:hypothetical protein